jgi:nitrogenase molybdenum-iron protein alpha/beta subunit
MSGYLSNITPDSFSGIIFALEGVSRTVVLLNGPTGCKFYHSSVSDNQTIKQFEFDPLNYPEKWYFGQPRVPCTYLDNSDYIYGSKDKLEEALAFLCDNVSFELLCIVNSPGAALIGDDLKGIAERIIQDRPVIIIETPGFSSDVCTGYETAAIELITQISPPRPAKVLPATVNIPWGIHIP